MHTKEFRVSSEKEEYWQSCLCRTRSFRSVTNPESVTSFLFLQRHWLADLCVSWTQTWVLLGSKDWNRGCWQESRDVLTLHAFPVSLPQLAGRPFEDENSILNLFKCKFFCINSQTPEHCILLNLYSIFILPSDLTVVNFKWNECIKKKLVSSCLVGLADFPWPSFAWWWFEPSSSR